jgi:preprotein translocase subunit SecA
VIPTNKPVVRVNFDDQIYRTKREKYNAVTEDIEDAISKGRPVLVGTISVEVSETLSRMLKRKQIRHSVLNAKQHQSEAEIVAEAGRAGHVTIATNMAGRGTDIKLGPGVKESGGLHVIGTERHEARRIDLQLKGRCGRQGDPGSTKFFLCLEDDLMRLFGSDRIAGVMDRIGLEEGEVIKHGMITKSIERAQKKVESHNFSIRKHLLEYDDVMNRQREIIYDLRNDALRGDDMRTKILEMLDEYIEDIISAYTSKEKYSDEWNWDELRSSLLKVMLLDIDPNDKQLENIKQDELQEKLSETASKIFSHKESALGPDLMRQLERYAVLRVIDEQWKEHLYELDQIKEGINLRAYGQRDPLIEYKKESFDLFQQMLSRLNEESLSLIFKARIETGPSPSKPQQQVSYQHDDATGMGYERPPEEQAAARAGKKKPIVKTEEKIGRNDPCPCGSGKKYKKCCGMNK